MSDKGSQGETQLADDESDGSEVESWLRRVARVTDGDARIPLPQVGQIIGGKYRIEVQLGKGGMGAVYRATHVVSDKQVALKWMLRPASDERARMRFTREARAAGRIDHPNVVDVYDIGQDGDASYLVMEFLRGESLRACLERGRLSPTAVVDVLLPAMRGVAAAHREGVVHRDLKPDNIFLCRAPDGEAREAKVLDFGISAISKPEPDAKTTLTKEGAVLGTPAYMSPEQLEDVRNADARTDVYAFGVILYEALTGSVPFVADSYSALVLAIVSAKPRPPRELNPEISTELERLVLKALEKDRDLRVPSMEALIAALHPFASAKGEDSGERVAAKVQRPKTPFAARRARWTVAAAMLLVLAALAWWATQGPAPDQAAAGAASPPSVPGAAAEPGRRDMASQPAASSTTLSAGQVVQAAASATQHGAAGSEPATSPVVHARASDEARLTASPPRRERPRPGSSKAAAPDVAGGEARLHARQRAQIAASDKPVPDPAATQAPAPKTTDRRTPNLSLEDF